MTEKEVFKLGCIDCRAFSACKMRINVGHYASDHILLLDPGAMLKDITTPLYIALAAVCKSPSKCSVG